MLGGKKIQKTVKTKFKKNRDFDSYKQTDKKRHHDKTIYRLVKQEKEEYVV
jgi:hypothetical protein